MVLLATLYGAELPLARALMLNFEIEIALAAPAGSRQISRHRCLGQVKCAQGSQALLKPWEDGVFSTYPTRRAVAC
jgi:hypothetical protein